MVEFIWAEFSVGDKVQVVATKEQLEEICAEGFEGCIGNITYIKGDKITVQFVNEKVQFNTYMLEKNTYTNDFEGDIVAHEDWLSTSEADKLADAYAEAYGEL